MGERSYLSIGEVLSLLRPEFPDLTISKIRFLESQGLLDPERTPSGYRKFYDQDIDRLRWILTQQREQYLPLKVIKGRLGSEINGDGDDEMGDHPEAGAVALAAPAAPITTSGEPAEPPSLPSAAVNRPAVGLAAEASNPLQVIRTGVSMTVDELASAAALKLDEVKELERFGLIAGKSVGGTTYYDEESLIVANLAAGFMAMGVEARHLRMYKTAAEREAGFFEQLVMPMLKQRNPRSRKQAVDTLVELSRLGQGLRAAMLRMALRDHTSG